MKAAAITSFGDSSVIKYCDLTTPEPADDEVRIKVLACGINHYDIFFRRGQVNPHVPLPHVVGADVVGEIEAVGAKAAHLRAGQRVVVVPGYPVDPAEHDASPPTLARSYSVVGGAMWGGYAEYIVVPAKFILTELPDLPNEDLATLPLVMTTAVHAVKTLAHVTSGQKVMVQAGASGSGAMCVQVAKALGAEVLTTVGHDEKFEFVQQLGADQIVNYSKESFLDRVKHWTAGEGVDAVIDNVGASVFDRNIKALKRGGHFVNFGMMGGREAPYVFPLIFYKQLHLHGSMMGTVEELTWGLNQVRQGRIRPILDKTFPLKDAAKAHEYIEQRKVKGKVVLLPE